MINSKQIPELDGYYWVKMESTWEPQIIEYVKGVVYIVGSRERYSPYYDVCSWHKKIEY